MRPCFITILTTASHAAMSACLDAECADVAACLEGVLAEMCWG